MKNQEGRVKERRKKRRGRKTSGDDHKRDRRDSDKGNDEIECLREYEEHRKNRMEKSVRIEKKK